MPGARIVKTWQSDPSIAAPARHKRACRYEAFIPDELQSLEISLSAGTAGMVSEAEGAIRSLNASARPALAPLARLLLRTESIASSKVEGMQMGVRELARAEARMEAGGRRSETAAEILDNVGAMETAIGEAVAAARFGERETRAIHRRLMMHEGKGRRAGAFRTGQNWIGGNDYNPCGADFVPPPVEKMPRLLDELYAAVNDDTLPPIVQAALVHAQFETIHPFDDGNGRTGRALIHVILRRRGLAPTYVPPISVVLASGREQYIAGLTRFRGTGVEQWLDHFAQAATQSAMLAMRYLRDVEVLMADWRERLTRGAAPRADAAAWAIIEVLPAHPILSGPVAAAATGRSRGPVYEALTQLQEAGVLVPLSAARRNQSWEASGLLALLESLEAGEMPEETPPARGKA